MFSQCCQKIPGDDSDAHVVVQLTSDVVGRGESRMNPVHLLTSEDQFRSMLSPISEQGNTPELPPTPTARQQDLNDRLCLPTMRRYPVPPGLTSEAPEAFRQSELLRMYKEFVIELHTGMLMQQYTANQEYSDIHCQILDDLQTLKVDQGSGCIVEFPLKAVSKVYRIVKNDDKWYNAGSLHGPTPPPPLPLSNAEHIVVVEFVRRKLAFVFQEMKGAQRFLVCMELVIRQAKERSVEVSSLLQRCSNSHASESVEQIPPKAPQPFQLSPKWANGGPRSPINGCGCSHPGRKQVLM